MWRTVAVFSCLLLVFGALCPAFCVQQTPTHACCPSKAPKPDAKPCGHSGLAQSTPHAALPLVIAGEIAAVTHTAAIFAAPEVRVIVHPPPPLLFRILRI